eukprot:gene679-8910_t
MAAPALEAAKAALDAARNKKEKVQQLVDGRREVQAAMALSVKQWIQRLQEQRLEEARVLQEFGRGSAQYAAAKALGTLYSKRLAAARQARKNGGGAFITFQQHRVDAAEREQRECEERYHELVKENRLLRDLLWGDGNESGVAGSALNTAQRAELNPRSRSAEERGRAINRAGRALHQQKIDRRALRERCEKLAQENKDLRARLQSSAAGGDGGAAAALAGGGGPVVDVRAVTGSKGEHGRLLAAERAAASAARWRRRIAVDVQGLMLRIELERERRRHQHKDPGEEGGSDASTDSDDDGNGDGDGAPARPPPTPPRRGAHAGGARVSPDYPFGWDPPGPRHRMQFVGLDRRVALGGKASFVWGQRTYEVLGRYLADLQWREEGAEGGAAGITWLELVLDYEVSTGHNLPKVVTAHGSEARRAEAAEAYVVGAQREAAEAQGVDGGAEPAVQRLAHRLEIVDKTLAYRKRRSRCIVCTREVATGSAATLMKSSCLGKPESKKEAIARMSREAQAAKRARAPVAAVGGAAAATAPRGTHPSGA